MIYCAAFGNEMADQALDKKISFALEPFTQNKLLSDFILALKFFFLSNFFFQFMKRQITHNHKVVIAAQNMKIVTTAQLASRAKWDISFRSLVWSRKEKKMVEVI